MMGHSIRIYSKSFSPFTKDNLHQQTIDFAHLSNIVALLGGQIKSNQSLSGDMADILSNIYLGYSLVWYQDNYDVSDTLTNYCLKRLLYENSILFNRVIDNYPNKNIKLLINHIKRDKYSIDYNENRILMNELLENKTIMNHIKENIYLDEAALKLEKLDSLDSNSDEYHTLLSECVSVGEYPN